MSVLTLRPMRLAVSRVALPAARPQARLVAQLPTFSGLRLANTPLLQITGKGTGVALAK
jgi:hypothetical protein